MGEHPRGRRLVAPVLDHADVADERCDGRPKLGKVDGKAPRRLVEAHGARLQEAARGCNPLLTERLLNLMAVQVRLVT